MRSLLVWSKSHFCAWSCWYEKTNFKINYAFGAILSLRFLSAETGAEIKPYFVVCSPTTDRCYEARCTTGRKKRVLCETEKIRDVFHHTEPEMTAALSSPVLHLSMSALFYSTKKPHLPSERQLVVYFTLTNACRARNIRNHLKTLKGVGDSFLPISNTHCWLQTDLYVN